MIPARHAIERGCGSDCNGIRWGIRQHGHGEQRKEQGKDQAHGRLHKGFHLNENQTDWLRKRSGAIAHLALKRESKERTMKPTFYTTLTALILAATLGAPLAAQDAQLSGTVTESFGQQVIVATSDGRLLVTLPDGTQAPATGAQVDLTGTRDGETFNASALAVVAMTGPGEATLPEALRGLGLSDIRSRSDDDGDTYIYARMSGDGWLRAETRGGQIEEVQSESAGLPDALIAALLPDTIRNESRVAELARITEIDFDDDGEISIEGTASDGMRVEMEFGPTSDVRDYERERDDRASLSEAAARERLAALGYTQIGYV
jgi:hypothetical protein